MRSISCVLLFLAALWLNPQAMAAIYTVTTTTDAGAGSLRQALASAKTQGGSNTIVFDPALSGQTITLASELVVNDGFSAAHHLTIDATALSGGLVISGNQTHRIFVQNQWGTNLTLRGLTLSAGKTTQGGGAIRNRGDLTLVQCALVGNSASYGGAIDHDSDSDMRTLTMIQCWLSVNQALDGSGAVSLSSITKGIFTECTFLENSATGVDSHGGAIGLRSFSWSLNFGLTLNKCAFIGNAAAGSGGAIRIDGSIATGTGCTFSSNTGATSGGAVSNSGGEVSFARCTFSENTVTGGSGGAVLNSSSGELALTQCTFTGNIAGGTGNGGAISNFYTSSLAVTQCTISGNNAGSGGGGGGGISNHLNGSVMVTNSIIAGNTASIGTDIRNDGGTLGRAGVNLIGNPDSATAIFPFGMPNASGDYVGTSAAPLDPLLGPLADNGGPTRTMALLTGSLARNRSAALYPPLTADQRGRPILHKPDIGAYENQFGVVHRPLLIPSDAEAGSVICTLETDGTVTASSSNPAVIPSENILITGTGLNRTITITPIDGQVGNSTVVLTHQPSGETDTFQVYALSPAYVPVSIGFISDRTINEDASTLSVPFTVTDPAGAGLTISVDSSNPTLVPIPSIGVSGNGSNRTLALTPVPNENGNTQITVTTTDGLTTASRSFVLTVNAVNDVPSFIKGADQFVESTTDGRRDVWWASAVSAGPANESSQALTFVVTNNNNALFGVQPTVSSGGYLTYAPVLGAEGMATVSVRLRDNAGTANGGVDTTPVQTFTIRVVTSATPTIVTNSADSGPGSLREMVSIAHVKTGADVITFLPQLSGQVITLASEIEIGGWETVTIDATALPGGVTISGNQITDIFIIYQGRFAVLRGLKITAGKGYSGGAIRNYGTCELTECTLSGNSANGDGGAIYNDRGDMTLTRCALFGNSATSDGGAIFNVSGKMALRQCTLSGNSAVWSGALYHHSSFNLILTQCTLSGNSATSAGGGRGGAIYLAGWATLTHCTLSGNSAYRGGAIYQDDSLLLHNCIVAANSASNSGPDIYNFGFESLAPWGVNVIGRNSTVSSAFPPGSPNVHGNYVGFTANPLNPQLAPLGNYGGPTQTMALLPNSVARNRAGAVSPAITSDQRGFPIVGPPDVGAYESGTTNTFSLWSLETLGSAPSFADDTDHDGHADGLEYATRTNPAVTSTSPLTAPTRNAAGAMEIRFPYRPGATDVRYVVRRSPDLATWTEIYRYDTRTGVIEELGITAEENVATEIITITDPVDTTQSFWTLRTELVP
jgi:hypothetical protein